MSRGIALHRSGQWLAALELFETTHTIEPYVVCELSYWKARAPARALDVRVRLTCEVVLSAGRTVAHAAAPVGTP
jgi:hypothetical protein